MKDDNAGQWWQSPALAAALIVASAIPLLWPEVPPLVDVPGHMGRYKVQLDIDQSQTLQRYYHFNWTMIGNLGVDLLVVPLSKLLGLEPAVKLVTLLIPPLTVGGFLWVASEVHGRIPPTALFAVPLAYNYPFHYGFINFTLSMALAFLALGLWLRLARFGRFRLRAALFVPISCLLWLTHTYGWGTLGVTAFSAELVRQHDRGHGLKQAALRSAGHCLSLVLPLLLMLLWRSGNVGGSTTGWFLMKWKANWVIMALRDRWRWFDLASLGVIFAPLIWAVRSGRLTFSRNLAASALFLTLVFLLLPRKIFGSFYADMRIVPYVIAVAVLAIRLKENASRRMAAAIAFVAIAFIVVRTTATTASLWLYDRDYDRQLEALDHIPHGARLLSLVGRTCKDPWMMTRLGHLPAMALIRKEAFSNDQWTTAGAQLLSIAFEEGGFFVRDPTQYVTALPCEKKEWLSLDQTLTTFPRSAFDYVWLIDPPKHDPALLRGLRPLWRSGSSAVYQVESREPLAQAAEHKRR